MAVYFLDSSAIIKAYVAETGSTWVSNLVDPANSNKIYLAHITSVEVVSAISRGARGHGISASDASLAISNFLSDFTSTYNIFAIDQIIINRAISLTQKYFLRGYDAVQFAVACELHDSRVKAKASAITFVCSDTALNSAALTEGLLVDDPNSHP